MISDPGEVSIPGYMPKYGPLVPHFDQYSIPEKASKKKASYEPYLFGIDGW